LAGVGIGAAGAAAAAAIVASIIAWIIRSPTEFTSFAVTDTGTGAFPVVIGACVLGLLATWRMNRLPVARLVTAAVAVALGAWSAWNLRGLYRHRAALPFLDSTGMSVIAATATLAAVAAVVLAVATIAFARDVSGRTALCTFLVVVVAVTALTYSAVQSYRAGVWYPELTATASTPAPIPDTIGPVGYRIPLSTEDYRPDVHAIGNGFIVDTRTQITAYDGVTGAKRWQVGGYGSGRVLVARRNPDDLAGVVVVFAYDAMIAFDGSTGEVLWRRQLADGGTLTAAVGAVDALGMSIFTADAPEVDNSRTQFYSLDPATGSVRWNRHISCSNPTLEAGTASQFAIDCERPSLMDAYTGNTIDVPGEYAPRAGDDAYVVNDPPPPDVRAPTTVTRVLDPAGKVIDEVPATYPVSVPHNGFLLVYGANDTWLLRDYRNHRSIQVPIDALPGRTRDDVDIVWLNDTVLIANRFRHPHRLELLSLTRPSDLPTATGMPCPGDESLWDIQAAAGAVVVECRSEVDGMVPQSR
jgi:outer membrane protein assembly factor BamB/uncharacterized membrane protein YvlD (DUF360 family)